MAFARVLYRMRPRMSHSALQTSSSPLALRAGHPAEVVVLLPAELAVAALAPELLGWLIHRQEAERSQLEEEEGATQQIRASQVRRLPLALLLPLELAALGEVLPRLPEERPQSPAEHPG